MIKRFFIISVTLVVTFLYAKYAKNSFQSQLLVGASKTGEVLDELPKVSFSSLKGLDLNLVESSAGKKYFFVHFWATWCAPCEAEFPEFLKLAKKHNNKIKFYLVAVNDELEKVEKFISKYKAFLNEDIVVLMDNKGEYYSKFGTAKVPETYIFSTTSSKLIRKFTGPQSWERANYSTYLKSLN